MALVVVRNSNSRTDPASPTSDSPSDKNVVVLELNTAEESVSNESTTEAIPAQEPLNMTETQEMNKSKSSDDTGSNASSDLQYHLLAMFNLLDPSHVLKMAVKLESSHVGRTRYLAVVSCKGKQENEEETCLLGVDGTVSSSRLTLGLVVRVYADTSITLDGDGGLSLSSGGQQHIFKPVSVHTMWAVLQTLHKAKKKAEDYTHFVGGQTHQWAMFYEQRLSSDQSCINEWHAMGDIESRRPPSPDCIQKPKERADAEWAIRSALKEVMMTVDLDEVTSKFIRAKVEEKVGMECSAYKSFIDEEMLTILGQMDKASQIFEHVFLGSEWNASNLEELKDNSVGYILNVTKEIDNFFPHLFEYMNIRVYDDEATELLKYWEKTYKYISKAQKQGSKVLVHCKMGVSRSASVVIAYAMKAYDWDLPKALEHVCGKRSCVNPNESFRKQLEIYAGILDASKHRHNKLFRSKSETNLKKTATPATTPLTTPSTAAMSVLNASTPSGLLELPSLVGGEEGVGLAFIQTSAPPEPPPLPPPIDSPDTGRPKSWSPDESIASTLFPSSSSSLPDEALHHSNNNNTTSAISSPVSCSVLKSCNGRTYSVSQNRAVQLETASSAASSSLVVTARDGVTVATEALDFGESCSSSSSNSASSDAVFSLVECFNPWIEACGAPVVTVAPPEEISCLKRVPSVKDRICELESAVGAKILTPPPPPDRTGLVLSNLTQFEPTATPSVGSRSKPTSPVEAFLAEFAPPLLPATDAAVLPLVRAQWKPPVVRHQAVLVRPEHYSVPDESTEVLRNPFPTPAPPVAEPKKQNDAFSDHLDRVFDREERSEHRKSLKLSFERESPSRQSSWGSYDSAYVQDDRDVPSRQHSWSSSDTRSTPALLPSRNSSFGSYDMRMPLPHVSQEDEEEESVQYETSSVTGTIKRQPSIRTGSKEEGEEGTTVSAEGKEPVWHARVLKTETRKSVTHYASSPSLLHCMEGKETPHSLPKSAGMQFYEFPASLYLPATPILEPLPPLPPPLDDTPLPGTVRMQLQLLESFQTPAVTPSTARKEYDNGETSEGVVRRLKEELEAKSMTQLTPIDVAVALCGTPAMRKPRSTTTQQLRKAAGGPGLLRRRSVSVDKMNCRGKSPSPPLSSAKNGPFRSFSQSAASAEEESSTSPDSDTDLTVRSLVDKFEVVDRVKRSKERPRVHSDPAPPTYPPIPLRQSSSTTVIGAAPPQVPARVSSLESDTWRKPTSWREGSMKPPPGPLSLFAAHSPSLHVKAKKHQGKTHPLAQLSRSVQPLSSSTM